MNKTRYRIIFNKARSQLVAVAENAASHSKGSHGESRSTAPTTDGQPDLTVAGVRCQSWRLAVACWLVVGAFPMVQAQIIADRNAPANQRPTILVDGTGRPLVNIQTPSAAGVSRNTYEQFDVKSNGVVLNNARVSNPWLATGEARVILNEVNSNNPSYLSGAITVNGASAQIVVANPSGITVDGASFVNASRATLTTGVPVMNNGKLDGLNVSQGTIKITGNGLNASTTSFADILSRAAVLTGRINANDLNITTGTQKVDYATGQISSLAGVGATPAIAIDTGQLGGMYAVRITLLATEAGVGVRNAGTLQATGGQLIVTADGRLENTGSMKAAITSVATVQGDIVNNGTLQGSQLVMVSSGNNVALQGKGMSQNIASSSTVMVNAKGRVDLTDSASVDSHGTAGQVIISAGDAISLGKGANISADGNVDLSTERQINAQNSTLKSTTADVVAVSAQGINLNSVAVQGKRVQLETGAAFKETSAPITISSSTIAGSEQVTLIATGDLLLSDSTLKSDASLHIESDKKIGINTTSLSAAGALSVVGAGVNLSGVQVQATGSNASVDVMATQSDLNLNASYDSSGTIKKFTNINTTGALRATSILGDINIKALQATADKISIISTGNNSISTEEISSPTYIAQVNSKLLAVNNITLASIGKDKALSLYGAQVQASQGDVWLTSADKININSAYDKSKFNILWMSFWLSKNQRGTLITAATDIGVSSGGGLTWDNLTSFKAARDLSISAGSGDITLNAGNPSQFQAARDLSLVAKAGTLTLQGSNGTSIGGSTPVRLNGLRDINLQGANVDLQGSYLYATRNIAITSTSGDVWLNALTNNVREENYDNIYTDHVNLYARSALTITSARDIQAQGLNAWSGNTTLQSVGDIAISGTASTVGHFDGNSGYWRFTSGGDGNWVSHKRIVNTSYVSGDNGVKINAGGNIDINATSIQGSSGYASLTALGSIKLNAAQNWSSYDATSSGWKSTCFLFFCNKTTWTDYYLREYLTTAPTSVYGKGVRINAGNDIETYGARIQSWWNEVSLVAGGTAKYYAVYDQQNFKDTRDSKSSFIGIKYSTDRSISSSLSTAPVVTRLQSQNELTSSSGGDTLLQGTLVNAPGGALFQAGVGEKARADARIVLEGVKSTVQTAQTRESNYVLWQKQSGQGGTVETMALPTFVGGVSFTAPGGLSVQIPQSSDFKTQVQSLASQPGMGYLNTLTTRSDVNWQPVKLAFDKWSYSQSGLTPAGAALLAVAVAWATGGMGAELLGSAGTTTTTVGGVATTSYTTAGLVANAAFTSLASQASITLINNKGDVGKTLKDLGSSSTVKAALAAALTAGVLDKVGALPGMQTLKGGAEFSDKLTYNLINATGRALTNTAINGGSLEDALKAAIVGGIVDTAHGEVASRIKVLEETDYIAHKLAHALAGCVAGAAAGGACQDGAIGAAVGEMVAQLMPPANGKFFTDAEKAKILAYSKLVAGGVAAYAGGNAQTAITTAETAVLNNYLTDTQKQQRDREIAACKTSLACMVEVKFKYDGTSAKQDVGLMVGIVAGIGYQSAEQALALVDLVKNLRETMTTLTAIVNDPEFRNKVGSAIADDYRQRIEMQTRAYNEGGWGGSVTAGVEAGRLAVDIVMAATLVEGVGKVVAVTAKAGASVVASGMEKLAWGIANGGDALLDGASGVLKAPKSIEYTPTGSVVLQPKGSPLCGPATCNMVINDAKGNSVDLNEIVGQFHGVRSTGVNINEMNTVLSQNGVIGKTITTLSADQLNVALASGQPVIVCVPAGLGNHFIIVDAIKIVDNIPYYMTRDPFVGPRGVRSDLLTNAIVRNGNAIIIGK